MTTVTKFTTPGAAGAEVSRRTEAHMAQHQGVGYQEALHDVLAADPELAQAYGQPTTRVARMATTDKRSAPAIPITSGEEAEIREWVTRAVRDDVAGMLPGELGKLALEAARFKKAGMPVEEATQRAMGLFPSLVALSKLLLADIRRNRPEVEPVADGETGLAQGKPEPKPPGNPAGFAVHARAEALMQEHPELDYREAVGAALSEDPQLKLDYAAS
jgi:hypothetical protein